MSASTINRAIGPLAPGQVAAAVTTAQIFPLLSSALVPCTVFAEGDGILEQREFTVRASGYVTTSGAYTVVASLYANLVIPAANPLVAASWTLLGASTARAVGTTTAPWKIQAKLISDAVSGKLHGEFSANINNLLDGFAALGAVLPGVNLAKSLNPAIVFAVGLTFSTGAVTNIGNLGDFALDF